MKVYFALYLDADDDEHLISVHSTRQGAKNACYAMDLMVAEQDAKFPPFAAHPDDIKLVWNDVLETDYSVTISDESVLSALNVTYVVEEHEVFP